MKSKKIKSNHSIFSINSAPNQCRLAKMKLVSLLMLILFVCQGCGGVATVGEMEKNYTNPKILSKYGEVSSTEYLSTPTGKNSEGITTVRVDPNIYNVSTVKKFWGEPDYVSAVSETTQHLIYNREIGWSGIVFIITVIPIPVVIPVGYRKTILTVEDNMIVNAKYFDGRILQEASFGYPKL